MPLLVVENLKKYFPVERSLIERFVTSIKGERGSLLRLLMGLASASRKVRYLVSSVNQVAVRQLLVG